MNQFADSFRPHTTQVIATTTPTGRASLKVTTAGKYRELAWQVKSQ